MKRLAALCLAALACVLAACGSEEPQPTVEELLRAGQEAFARGDALAQASTTQQAPAEAGSVGAPDVDPAAVGAWAEAADNFRDAFRFLDPDPEAAQQRGMLAFRIARAYSKAALQGRVEDWANFRANHALLWLDEAERLAPGIRQVHYERARIYDSAVEGVRDRVAAYAAYKRYVIALNFAASIPDAEKPRAKHARERERALKPPEGAVPR